MKRQEVLDYAEVILQDELDWGNQERADALRETIKAFKQEPILDKIRAEIEQIAKDYDKFADYRRVRGLWIALEIIDKYKAESETQESEVNNG